MPIARPPLVAQRPPWCLPCVPNDDLRIHTRLVIPAAELTQTASRSSGPGGQHVNKTSTRVSLRWNARESTVLSDSQRHRLLAKLAARLTRTGDLVVHCGTSRSFSKNRETARERLAEIVREALHRQRRRVPTRAGRGVREQRLREKKQRSATKERRRRPGPDDH